MSESDQPANFYRRNPDYQGEPIIEKPTDPRAEVEALPGLNNARYSPRRTHGVHDHEGADCPEYVVGRCILALTTPAHAADCYDGGVLVCPRTAAQCEHYRLLAVPAPPSEGLRAALERPLLREVLDTVTDERRRQDRKWGEQNHGDLVWLAVLSEEVGEAAREILEVRANTGYVDPLPFQTADHLAAELVQVAAVAVAWVEAIYRRDALAVAALPPADPSVAGLGIVLTADGVVSGSAYDEAHDRIITPDGAEHAPG